MKSMQFILKMLGIKCLLFVYRIDKEADLNQLIKLNNRN